MFIHRSRIIAFAILLTLLAVAVPGAFAQSENASKCTPNFPFVSPWLGSDDAYSIPLADGRSVWIFGDTLTGKERKVVGDEPEMVRNSIGVSRCDAKGFQIDYIIRHDKKGALQDFFAARVPKTWYWALDGFRHNNELWVTLLCLRATPVGTPGFGFETCGSDLARVSHLDRDPQQWDVKVFPLVPDGAKAYPSSATVVDGKHAYLFALYETGSRPLIVARIPLSGLSKPAANMQYLANDGVWKKGFVPANAKQVMDVGNTEMTIRYHPETKQWIAVMNDPQYLSDKLVLRRADNLTGPWSKHEVIYTIPDMQKSAPNYDSDTFCYAGKEHPEFRTAGTILVTYACNSTKPAKLVSNTGIYFPKVIRLPLAK